jgi:hypothetical protein
MGSNVVQRKRTLPNGKPIFLVKFNGEKLNTVLVIK